MYTMCSCALYSEDRTNGQDCIVESKNYFLNYLQFLKAICKILSKRNTLVGKNRKAKARTEAGSTEAIELGTRRRDHFWIKLKLRDPLSLGSSKFDSEVRWLKRTNMCANELMDKWNERI